MNTYLHDSIGLLVDVSLKALLLAAAAWLLLAALRIRDSNWQHRTWTAVLTGMLLLPLLVPMTPAIPLPSWLYPELPPLAQAAPESAEVVLESPPAAPVPQGPVASEGLQSPIVSTLSELRAGQEDFGPEASGLGGDRLPEAELAADQLPPVDPESLAAAPAPATLLPEEASAELPAAPRGPIWPMAIAGLYGIGISAFGLRLAAGLWQAHRLTSRSRPIEAPEVVRRSLGRCRIRECAGVNVPVTVGCIRPTVLLPADWNTWPDALLRTVLAHELAHVSRGDQWITVLAELNRAIYWFHPIAWHLRTRLATLAEQNCDDAVIESLGDRTSYARSLIAVAGRVTRRGRRLEPMGTWMARRSNVEVRIDSILDTRRPLARRIGAIGTLLLLAITVPTVLISAGLRPGADAPEAEVVEPADVETASESPETTAEESTTAPSSSEVALAAPTAADKNAQTLRPEDVTLHYHGRVVDPTGQPVAGAKLYLVYWIHGALPGLRAEPTAVTQADGSFDFSLKEADLEPGAESAFANCTFIVTADGFGFASGRSMDFETTGNAVKLLSPRAQAFHATRKKNPDSTLHLVADETLSGQILSTEGQPVAGARVVVDQILMNDEGSLDAWEKEAKEPKADFYALRNKTPNQMTSPLLTSVFGEMTTGADGKFTFRGIGRERIAQLLVTGPTIETNLVKARTRVGEKVVVPHQWSSSSGSGEKETFYGNDFAHVVGPSQAVVGRITDVETGEPIAGVLISAGQRATFFGMGRSEIATITDSDGRYSLQGLPPNEKHDIYAFPQETTAHLPSGSSATVEIGQPPATLDFQLRRGIWARGQVVDQRTKQPVTGPVHYYGLEENPHLQQFEGLRRAGLGHERRTDRNGNFEIAVPPGPGILTFMPDDHTNYKRGQGLETVTAKSRVQSNGIRVFQTATQLLTAENTASLHGINPAVDSEGVDVAFTLASGVEIAGRILDADGKPLVGGIVSGTYFTGSWSPIQGEAFHVQGYYASEPRDLFFYHRERDLAGHYRLEGEAPTEIVVTLEPAGRLRGRLVDDEGAPVAGIQLSGAGVPSEPFGNAALRLATGDDGRFEVRGLMPGWKYSLEGRKDMTIGRVLSEVAVEAGQELDVGDVKLLPSDSSMVFSSPAEAAKARSKPNPIPPEKKESDPAASRAAASSSQAPADDDDLITVRGRVLDAAGKPADNATVRLVRWYWDPSIEHKPLNETQTDSDGRFETSYRKSQFNIDVRRPEQWKEVHVAAFKAGSGPDWQLLDELPAGEDVELQLTNDDVAIAGRVVDLEGQPIAGVQVVPIRLNAPNRGDLSAWLAAVKLGEPPWTAVKHVRGSGLPAEGTGLPREVVTDADGQFRLSGAGSERTVELFFQGSTVARALATAVTRQMSPVRQTAGRRNSTLVLGAEFELALAPTRAIEGVVRDAATREALVGVTVTDRERTIRAVTDEQGRFQLIGLPKEEGSEILAVPSDEQPYLIRELEVPDEPGLDPVTVDFEMHRGIWITGRVTDKVTGEPVRMAELHYLPFLSNEHAQALPELEDGSVDGYQNRYETAADGTYRLVGLPGRAIVGVVPVEAYPRGAGAAEIEGMDDRGHFATFRNPIEAGKKWPIAMKEIDPAEDAGSIELDFALDPGKTIELKAVDSSGAPIADVSVDGLSPRGLRQTAGPRFNAIAFGPDEERTILFHQEERGLGKVIRARADDAASKVTVRLEPCATISGRLVDENQTPVTGVAIWIDVLPRGGGRLDFVATDATGRFEHREVLPGTSYTVAAESGRVVGLKTIAQDLAVEPGETIDLGTIDITSDERPEPKRLKAALASVAADAAASPATTAAADVAPRHVITGTITGPDGQPAAGAQVAAIGFKLEPDREPTAPATAEVLAKGTTDDSGHYELELANVSGTSHHHTALMAHAKGAAIAAREFDPDTARAELPLALAPEQLFVGRLEDAEGQPADGVRLKITSLVVQSRDGKVNQNVDFSVFPQRPSAWPQEVVTDEQGRFSVAGIAAEQSLIANIEASDRFASQSVSLGTNREIREQGTNRVVKVRQPGEEVVIRLRPATGGPTDEASQPVDAAARHVITGTITGPDGKPAVGAHVAAIGMRVTARRGGDHSYSTDVLAQSTTDERGQYELALSGVSSTTHRYTNLIARADGAAVAWQRFDPDAATLEAPLQLPAEQLIRGRLVDIEGQPAPDVRLSVASVIVAATDGKFSDGVGCRSDSQPPAAWLQPSVTDAQGRFTIAGVAAGHGVFLDVEGSDRFAPQELALNTGMSETRGERDGTYRSAVKNAQPGEEIVLPLAPAQIFEGVVRYEDTGEPAPNARVSIWASQQPQFGSMVSVAGTADEQGRYRVNPKPGVRFGVKAYAPNGAPYLTREVENLRWDVSDTTKQVDVKLARGVLVRGRVVERGSNAPVAGASIQYHPESATNPNDADDIVTGWQVVQTSNEQGEFEIAVLPGPGRLFVHGPQGEFVLKEFPSRQLQNGGTGGQRYYCHAIEKIDPAAGDAPVEITFEVEPSAKIAGLLVDESGQSIAEAFVISRLDISHLNPWWRGQPRMVTGGHFQLGGLTAGQESTVYILDAKRKLGATAVLRAGDPASTIVLRPCGEVTARFTKTSGEARAKFPPNFEMVLTPGPSEYQSRAMRGGELAAEAAFISNIDQINHWPSPQTDLEGRITIAALVPGAQYRVLKNEFAVAKEFTVNPGEKLDLGEFAFDLSTDEPADTKQAAAPTAKPTESAAAAKADTPPQAAAAPTSANQGPMVRGQVTGPKGEAVAGAKLYRIVWTISGPQRAPELLATTDAKGAFEFRQLKKDAIEQARPDEMLNDHLVVVADGYGMAYTRPTQRSRGLLESLVGSFAGLNIQLQLEVPIKGRIVDVEGQPITGARVSLRKLTTGDGPMDNSWRKDLEARNTPNLEWRMKANELFMNFFPARLPEIAPTATTGADGGFELRGLPPDRIVQLLVTGEGVESVLVFARTMPGEPVTIEPDQNYILEPITLYGPTFTRVISASRPIEGRVLDVDTGKPIAGAVVRAYAVHGERLSSSRNRQHFATLTDVEGRYRITGLPMGDENRLVAFVRGEEPYIPTGLRADTSAAGGPTEHDFLLQRGIWATGKAFDATTQKPLRGEVSYHMFRDPELEKKIPGLRFAYVDEYPYLTNASGEFRVPVLRGGRGILGFSITENEESAQYPRGVGAQGIAGYEGTVPNIMFPTIPHYLLPANYQAVAEVSPKVDDETAVVDFALAAGKHVSVRIVDENDRPVMSASVYGLKEMWGWQPVQLPVVEVIGLQPGKPRKLFVFHRERNLAGATTVDDTTDENHIVKLSAAGSVRGRLVDQDGEPVQANISADYYGLGADDKIGLFAPDPRLVANNQRIVTDSEGRFQLDGLVPGWKYGASASAPRKYQGTVMERGIGKVFENLEIEPGQVRDLGDIRVDNSEE